MSDEHEHEALELPEPVRRAVEAGAEALAPMVEGCMECARNIAAAAILAALPELGAAPPEPNGRGHSNRAARRRWRS